jgi:hypothetical protein
MQPEVVNIDRLLVFELECPLSTVLVLLVLPFRLDALLEEMVVRLDGEIRGSSNVVLFLVSMTSGISKTRVS